MGTALTGLEIKDTYDSLIKVTDNGPLTGSLKVLTDGLGNDSTLSLSTAAASIAGTLAVSGNATFDTSTLVVDAANNRVGINKSVPTSDLDVSGTFAASSSVTSASLFVLNTDGALGNINSSAANGGYFTWQTSSTTIADIGTAQQIFGSGGNDTFGINARGARSLVFGSNNTERVRITSDAYLRMAASTGGIQFNGDTAAANALDDYEEGTWTIGVSFGGASVGVTYSNNTGTYTKIGRQVTVNGYLLLSNKGSSTGPAVITGLPFTIANTFGNYSTAALYLVNITFANQFQGNGAINTTNISINEVTEAGVETTLTNAEFANNSAIIVSLTYFV